MSIKADVRELESIRAELKILTAKRRALKSQEAEVISRISSYLKSKDQPGVKYQGKAIVMEVKETPSSKSNHQRAIDAQKVLEEYGVKDSLKVLEAVMLARKGPPVQKEKIKIKKYKEK